MTSTTSRSSATLGYFRFERRYLGPYYQRLIDAIRSVDQDTWIFVEPMAAGPNQGFRSRLPPLRDPRSGETRLAYFPHIYTLDLDLRGKYIGWPVFVNMWARARVREAARLGMPLLIGEFGLDGRLPGALDYVRSVVDTMDRVGSGWTYWCLTTGSWGLTEPDGAERPLAAALVRPYPRAVAGEPVRWIWEAESRTFTLELRDRDGVTGPTEISLPARRLYPEGFTVQTSDPEGSWTSAWEEERQVLSLTMPRSSGTHRVRIVAAGPRGAR